MRRGLGLGLGLGIRTGLAVVRFAIALLGIAGPLSAQMAGVPVFHSLKHDPRWSVHVDVGSGARAYDGLTFLGTRVSHALNSEAEQGAVRLSFMGGRLEPERGEASVALGVTAGLALRQRHLLQFEPQIGAGWTDFPGSGGGQLDVPLSLALGVVAGLPPLWFTALTSRNPQFWIAPRVQLRTGETPADETRVRGGFGLAGGMEFRAQNGLGVQFVWERVAMRDLALPRWRTEGAWGLSFFFSWI